jgi:dolichol-phosphate mannosyltransferase
VIVVVPTYNERENLPGCVERVLALGSSYRMIIVDDNSPDGTGSVAEGLARSHPERITVLHRPNKAGLGRALVAGFRLALASEPDIVSAMDADLSHDPADLPRLVAAMTDHDLAIGSRYAAGGGARGWPIHRRWLSRCGGRYAAAVLGVAINDLTTGFKVWRRAALEAVDLGSIRSDGYGFQIEITYRAIQTGLSVVEVPIIFTDRFAGTSKLSRGVIVEALLMVWRLRFHNAPRLGFGSAPPRGLVRPDLHDFGADDGCESN